MNQLQQAILRAHDSVSRGERGAKQRLERLQAEYRSGGHLVERPGGSCSLAGHVEQAPTRRKPRRAVSRAQDTSQKPYWQLREPEPEPWRLR